MSRFETPILIDNDNPNIFIITSIASSQMRRHGVSQAEITKMQDQVNASGSYEAACEIIKDWFPLKRQRKPSDLKKEPVFTRVIAPYFVAGFEWDQKKRRVIRAAPVLARIVGKPIDQALWWLKQKGYSYVHSVEGREICGED